MFIKNRCGLVLWTAVASALVGLTQSDCGSMVPPLYGYGQLDQLDQLVLVEGGGGGMGGALTPRGQ